MNIIEEQLNILPGDYRTFVTGGFVEALAESFAEEYGLVPDQVDECENAIYLFLLFLLSKQNVPTYLMYNARFSSAQANEAIEIIIELLPENFPFELIEDGSLQQEISDLESAIDHLEPIRTMAQDMESHQDGDGVYRSSQDSLLQRPQQHEVPRWETDNSS